MIGADEDAAVLLVDDEPNVLEGLKRNLAMDYDVVTATSGKEGLRRLAEDGPFAVVVSDMRMPGMDGAQFLAQARTAAPETVRMLLTGYAEVEAAIRAIQEGGIFRFLTKPCPPALLQESMEAAVEQHRLIHAERELLETTLRASVNVLAETLSMANPKAFGRANRVKRTVVKLLKVLEVEDRWPTEVAVTLAHLPMVTLPGDTLDRLLNGMELSGEETKMVERMPRNAVELVRSIPRMDPVLKILKQTHKVHGAANDNSCIGAKVLKVAMAYESLSTRFESQDQVREEMQRKAAGYDPRVMAALAEIAVETSGPRLRQVGVDGLKPGMVIDADVKTSTGALLVARGNAVTAQLLQRLQNFALRVGVEEPIRVVLEGPHREETGT